MTAGAGWKSLVALVLVISAAVAVRLVGLDVLLPMVFEPDVQIVVQAQELARGEQALARRELLSRKYPQLLARGLVHVLPVEGDGADEDGVGLARHLERASAPIRRARTLMAWISSLLVPATWFLARRFVSPGASLLATALVASSLLAVVNAKQARPHGPEAAFAVMALAALVSLRARPRLAAYLLAGGALALAVGTLQSGLFLLPAAAVAHVLREREPGRSALMAWTGPALGLALVAASIGWFYPPSESAGLSRFFNVGGLQQGLRDFNGGGFPRLAEQLLGADPVLAWMSLVGGLGVLVKLRSTAREARRVGLVVLAWAVPYSLVIGAYDVTQGRYLLPLLPLLAIAAAHAASLLASRLPGVGRSRPGLALALVSLLVLALPVTAVAKLTWLHQRPTTLDQAADWLASNFHPKQRAVALAPGVGLPLPTEWSIVAWRELSGSPQLSPWDRYQHARGSTLDVWPCWRLFTLEVPRPTGLAPPENAAEVRAVLAGHPFRYAVSSRTGHRWSHAVLSRQASPAAEFEPTDPPLLVGNGFQDRQLLQRVLTGVAWGPPVTIHRLP